MELWVRSQSKQKLTKVNELNIFDFADFVAIRGCINQETSFWLGNYKTNERALEVLDEIQNKIKQQFIVKSSALMSLEDIDKEENRLIWKYDKEFIMQDSGFEIVPINDGIIVYEMPEE